MSCIPIYKKPGCIVQGDTIFAWEIFMKTGYTGDLTTASISLVLEDFNGNEVYNVTNGNGITVTASDRMTIDKVVNNNFPVGNPIGDITIVEANSDTVTYFRIEFEVVKKY